MQEFFIDNTEDLVTFCDAIRGSEWLAIDTEFIREKTYYPRLCLLQIANEDMAACVDPIALTNLDPLLEVLFDGRILKVFHAARQDLEIFLNDWRQIPLPLFDTQPAAALLGYGDQIGYGRLVQETLSIDLPKDQSRTDWSRRPLDEGQIRYALDDVIYLGKVYVKMRGQLSDLGRLQWLVDDFAELADPATYRPAPDTLWKRVKGRQHVHGKKLAVLQQLAAWREQEAIARDLPRKWVLKDEVMVDLAKRLPEELHQLERIRGLDAGNVRRSGEHFLQLIKKGLDTPKEAWPTERIPTSQLAAQQQAMTDMLSAALRVIAEQQQLSPSAIGTRKQLEKITLGETDCELMKGWRKSIAGTILSQIVSGEKQLINQDGQLLIK